MRLGLISKFVGLTTSAVTAAMSLPLLWSLVTGDGGSTPILSAFGLSFIVSLLLMLAGRGANFETMDLRAATLCVFLSWIAASFVGSFPYVTSSTATLFDGFFEAVSGFTTTGASVLQHLEDIPKSIRLWRNLTQWLGGIGIVLITIALIPISGAGLNLYKAEIGGPINERLTPRIQQTALFLWKTYIGLTTIFLVLLLLGGLDLFDSLTLTFSTVATGGFSPYYANIGHFGSNYVNVLTALFLFLSAANLTFYHILLTTKRVKPLTRNPEFRCYIAMLLTVGTLTTLVLYHLGNFPSLGQSLKEGFFHTVSMLSTCGYFLSDYNLWPASARHLMLILMFIGGCAISTAGGITCIRLVVIIKHIAAEFVRILHPRAIVPTRVGDEIISASVVSSCFAFLGAYICVFTAGVLLLSFLGQDMTTAISGAAATLGNVGPGFGMVGPVSGYASQPDAIKLVYILLMLFGRLEIFTLLIIFYPRFWQR